MLGFEKAVCTHLLALSKNDGVIVQNVDELRPEVSGGHRSQRVTDSTRLRVIRPCRAHHVR